MAAEPLVEPTYKAQEKPQEMVLHKDDALNDKPVATIEPDTMARVERIRRNTRESIIRENAADRIAEISAAFQYGGLHDRVARDCLPYTQLPKQILPG